MRNENWGVLCASSAFGGENAKKRKTSPSLEIIKIIKNNRK
jgi:hypothetical protein